MKRIALTVAVAVAVDLTVACSPQLDHPRVGDIVISVPWSREVPKGTSIAVGYVTIENTGGTDDRLLAVESEAAQRVEIHEGRDEGGLTRMRRLTQGISIPAGRTVVLGPNGTHLMFIGRKRRIVVGAKLDAMPGFQHAGRVPVWYDVRDLGATHATGQSHQHH